jgi:hypothetical protein
MTSLEGFGYKAAELVPPQVRGHAAFPVSDRESQ